MLNVYHDTVSRVLGQQGVVPAGLVHRRSIIDPYLAFINQTLEQYPQLRASRLHAMVQQRGYEGGPDHFRHLIAPLRPRPRAEAYLRLSTLPGEQAQVDWAHFGHIMVGGARRALMGFVMVLSWSRAIFLHFFLNAQQANFLRGHQLAFAHWQGVPRVVLYDNLRSAVLERSGQAIRFEPTLLRFSSHYLFEARPVAVARGNEKGRVEKAIRYVRDSFFAARSFDGVDDLNAQARQWMQEQAGSRRHPEERDLTVAQALEQERPRLMALPQQPWGDEEQVVVSVGKTPYVRFDLNDYSVPHTMVRRQLTVLATLATVRILDGMQVVASHRRSFSRGERIEDDAHIRELVSVKRQAREHRGIDRLSGAAPATRELLVMAAERGMALGTITASLLRLLDQYGAAELQAATLEAVARGAPHPNSVRLNLERRRHERDQPPAVPVTMSEAVQRREVPVTVHDLSSYDGLCEGASS